MKKKIFVALAICRHIKLDGSGRCGSPAMRGQSYCYFHAAAHRAIPSVNLPRLESEGARNPWPRRRDMPPDIAAIQLGYTRLIKGLMQGLLNVRQAKLILAALNMAARLRRRTATEDSAVTSNQLRLPISGGRGAVPSHGPEQSFLRLLRPSESRGG